MADEVGGKKKKGKFVPIAIIVGIMALEGVGVFFLAKSLSPPVVPAMGGTETEGDAEDPGEKLVELELAQCRPTNKMAGRFVVFQIRVVALVTEEAHDRAREMARAKHARIEAGINAVIRTSEPNHFYEPKYETISRRLKKEFDQIFGDETLIRAVLIPELHQSGPGV